MTWELDNVNLIQGLANNNVNIFDNDYKFQFQFRVFWTIFGLTPLWNQN